MSNPPGRPKGWFIIGWREIQPENVRGAVSKSRAIMVSQVPKIIFFFPQKLKIDFWEKVPKIVFLVSFLTYTKAFMSMNGRKHCVQNDE